MPRYSRVVLPGTVQATGTGPFPINWSRNFNYDPYGNMWVTNATGITPAGNTPSAQSNFNASNNHLSTGRDAAGNQLMADGYQLTYDAENRQTLGVNGLDANRELWV